MNTDKALKFITIAESVAALSKDRSTKVGAVALGKAYEVRAVGFNGFPRGCNDDVEDRHLRPEKYFWAEHAERNLIYNAARVGTPLEGCTLIVTPLFPCMDCARAIVQAGFVRVIAKRDDAAHSALWNEHAMRSLVLFKECGIEVVLV